MIYRYASILLACLLLLIGIQAPGFVDQYEKRVDAHLKEVTENLKGFQEIADDYYDGSIEELIRKHESATDIVFQREAQPIGNMYDRYLIFTREKGQLDTNLINQVLHILSRADEELLQETLNSYTYTVTLDRESAISGAVLLVLGLILADLLSFSTTACIRKIRRRRHKV